MSVASQRPTEALTYDPNDEMYWSREGLDTELDRVYDICHGCRLCFNLCPSFPYLFDRIDDNDGALDKLTGDERQTVVDLCYLCKLCDNKCPYTPAEGHPFQLDFPRLMLRARAVKAKEEGIKPRERILGDPDTVGRFATLTPKLANWANKTDFHRKLMQGMLGIHKDKALPDFAEQTFEAWLDREGLPEPPDEPNAKVVLFHTCFVNWNNPEPGKAAVRALARNGCEIQSPAQNCCGMPALDAGDIAFAQEQASRNVESLLPYAQQGYKIAAINPTCSLMMKSDYPTLLGTEASRIVAAAVVDTNELLFELKKDGKFDRKFSSSPGDVAYHVPCHLRAQNIGYRSRDMMKLVPDSKIKLVTECCSHDGTWAMKTEFFEESMKWGKKAFDGLREADCPIMASDCPLAAVQIEQATGTRPLHPLEVLDRAYRADGFDSGVSKEKP